MFERLQDHVDFYIDHPGENEIILASEKYMFYMKNEKQPPKKNHSKDEFGTLG